MSTPEHGREPSEEELRAAYEAQIKQLRVEHLLLENVVTLVNLGMRRTGLSPGTEDERDAEQVRLAIESVRALLPVLEQTAPAQVGPIRDAVSQLQLAFVRIGGQGAEAGPTAPPTGGEESDRGGGAPGPSGQEAAGGEGGGTGEKAAPEEERGPGPAQRSGRLWVPGQ